MKRCLLTAVALLFTAFFMLAQAQQQNTLSIKGLVLDSVANKALDFVTVSLKNKEKQPLKSQLTKSNGGFEFSGLAKGGYFITVVYVGFQTKTVPVELTDNSIDLGQIKLAASNNNLKEVSITADRPLIKQEVDRVTYDIQADPESKTFNVLDMMRKVPMLSVDGDDNIKMQGNSNYKILINGKPSSMIARSPKDVLKAMPASSIQKIEVITTPPAKYDSEGIAGIINIITNKKVDNGYNGGLSINDRFPVGGLGGGLNFTVKQGKFGASGYGGLHTNNQPETLNNSWRKTTGTSPTDLMQENLRSSENTFTYFGSEFSFEIDTLNLITAEFGLNRGSNTSTGRQNSNLLNGTGNVLQSFRMDNLNDNLWAGFDLALNYQLGFKNKKDRLLTFSYNINPSHDDSFDELGITQRINYTTPNYHQTNNSSSSEQTIQVDYVHPVKKLTIEGGLKSIVRDNNADFEYQSLNNGTGLYETVDDRTNEYENRQHVFGVYNTYQYKFKDWGVKGGLRLESTSIKADFITNASEVDRQYFNLIPSISFNRKFKNMMNMTFGYTQRIQRPSIWNLNPFIDRSNPNYESSGNPNLRPVLSNNLQFSVSKFKKGSINIGLNYSFANNTIQQVTFYDAATNITRSNYENIGKDRSLGSNFNINYPFTPKWNFNISGNISYMWIQGTINGLEAKNSGMRGYFYGGTGYKFEKGWRTNLSFSYNSPYITLQGKGNGSVYSSLSLSKEIVKDKLTFSASSSNPFTKMRNYEQTTTGSNFTQFSSYRNYYRSFSANLNYRFGKLKGDIKKNQRGIKNDDVAGGKSGSN